MASSDALSSPSHPVSTQPSPTISDLVVLDDETISYTIKQSKTDQTKKGHFIYIFKLQSPLSPYQTLLAFLPPKEITVQTPIRPPFHRRLQPPRHSLVPKAPQGSPAPIRYPSRKLFQPFIPNRRSNHSGPQRPFPTADPRTRSLVVRGFQKLHSTKPLPHQGSPPDPNRPPPLEYTSETHSNRSSPSPSPPPPPQPNCFFPLPQQCPLPQELSLYFHHCRSNVYSRRSLFCISPRRSSDCSSERYLYLITTAVVTAPLRSATCISPLPSSDCSRRSAICIPSLPRSAAPAGAFSSPPPPPQPFFPPLPQQCPLRRSFLCISTIAAAVSTPEGAFSVFPLDAAVTAPAGALSVFHHYRCSDCSPQERYLYFPTAPAVIAPAGALSFPHYRSSACSNRILLYMSPLPQQWPLPQERYLFSHYRSSGRSRRSSLPFSHCPSSACPRRSFPFVSPLP